MLVVALYCILLKVLWYQGFPNGVGLWGDNLSIMAKNCIKITKSTFLGQNSRGHGGQVNFGGSGGIPPALSPLGETLGIKGTMSLRVSLPQSLSHLVGYENKISRREIYSID